MDMSKDRVIRAIAREGRVRILTCHTTELVRELARRHQTWPVVTAALGRTASIAAMMAMLLKNHESVTVKIEGDGPIGYLVVEALPSGDVRGYPGNPHVHLPPNSQGKLDVGGAIGRGHLYVVRDTGLRSYYTSSSELVSGEIADDFTYYFVTSEQTPSAVGAGVLVGTDNVPIVAGGFLIQLMPGHTEEDAAFVEERLAEVPSVTGFLEKSPAADALLFKLFPDAHILAMQDVRFHCKCSYPRLRDVLLSLGAKELRSMRDEQGQAELTCHFCGNVYTFGREELDEMIAEIERQGVGAP